MDVKPSSSVIGIARRQVERAMGIEPKRVLFKAYEMRRLVKPGQPRATGVRIFAL